MTNFDIFLSEAKFASFAEVAVSAERIYAIDPAACVLNCRRAMEFAVKWMYSVDGELVLPWDDKLVSLMSTDEFRDVVDANLLRRMDFIRKQLGISYEDVQTSPLPGLPDTGETNSMQISDMLLKEVIKIADDSISRQIVAYSGGYKAGHANHVLNAVAPI